jgi:polyketide synthase PksN
MADQVPNMDERRAFQDAILDLLWAGIRDAGFPLAGGTREEIGRAVGVSGFLERWIDASLCFLEVGGVLVRSGDKLIPASGASDVSSRWADWEARRSGWHAAPTVAPLVNLVEVALRALPQILSGVRRATDVLFPGGSLKLIESVYKHNPVADHFNAAVAETVAAIVNAQTTLDPAAKVRLIEFGAGTGGTSASVLARLKAFPDKVEEYCYTDLSHAFLAHGETSYGAEHPYLRTRIVNVEKPITEQGIGIGHYDIAVAGNVLHATRDVRRTLRNVKTVLRPNGVLILNELTDNTLFAHVTFGLIEGWWLSEDAPLRIVGSPFLTPESWQLALEAERFRTVLFPTASDRALNQQVIVAESDGLVRLPTASVARRQAAVRPTSHDATAPARHLERPVSAPQLATRPVRPAPVSEADLLTGVIEHLRQRFGVVLGIERSEIDVEAPVENYGVDSILTVRLAADLGRSFRNVGATLFFEHNTIASLASHLWRSEPEAVRALVGIAELPARPAPEKEPAVLNVFDPLVAPGRSSFRARETRPVANEVAIVGLAGRYPGGETVDAFWDLLQCGRSAIREIPPERWDWRENFDEERGKTGTNYARFGGFLDAIDAFDPLFFQISPRDAERMDPQERLFLEIVYACIEDAGYVSLKTAPSASLSGR